MTSLRPTMRVAVIDIGSNTVHLLVADCDARKLRSIRDESVDSGLGAAVADGKLLSPAFIQSLARSVARLARTARASGAMTVLAMGTHGVRTAVNSAELVSAVESAARVNLQVLSPEQEASLSLLGASLDGLPDPTFLFADIGGGSTDLAVIEGASAATHGSLIGIGSGMLWSRHLGESDPPSASNVRAAMSEVKAMLDATTLNGHDTYDELVLAGGAVRRILRQTGPNPRFGQPFRTDELQPLLECLLSTPSKGWPFPRGGERKVAVTRGGAIIVSVLLEHWSVSRWRISQYGLREGALLAYARLQPYEAAAPRGGKARQPEQRRKARV